MAAMQDRELGVEGAGPTGMLVNAEAEQQAPSNNTHTLKLRARCMTQSRLEVRVGLEVRGRGPRLSPLRHFWTGALLAPSLSGGVHVATSI